MVPRRTRRTGSRELTSAILRATNPSHRSTSTRKSDAVGCIVRRMAVRKLGSLVLRRPAVCRLSMALTSKRFTNTSTRNSLSAIEDLTRDGAPPAISMPNVSPADSERSVRNCRSVRRRHCGRRRRALVFPRRRNRKRAAAATAT